MTKPWYHKTTLYQIYPRSFCDSNGDGVGDLRGILQKLDYLQTLGVETLWISPFFASPQRDFGYDIADYTSIAPKYGTMDDAYQLIEQVHQRRMRIVFDMVMNHTSDEHPWFKESKASRHNPKADWYIWRDRRNNWNSMPGGIGWHFAPERGQYYWASFLPFQPDLNYRNPEVKQTMFDIVRFWLAKGVDGFRLDIFNSIYKDAEFRNNPFSFKLVPSADDPSAFFQNPKYTVNLPESFAFAKEFRTVCEEFGEKLSLGEVNGSRAEVRKFLGDTQNDGLTLVFDFGMMGFHFSADYFRRLIRDMEGAYPDPFMPVYVFSNHDSRRSMDKLGGDVRKAKLLAAFQLTVRGVPCLYNGEEIGMTNLPLPLPTALDPIPRKFKFIPRFIFDLFGLTINRDEVRTPMQWDATRNAGFSSAEKTWLPVNPNYVDINVGNQNDEDNSLLNVIRAVLKIRNGEKALQEGPLELMENLPASVLGYARTMENQKIIVLLNFDEREQEFFLEGFASIFKLSELDGIKNKTIHLDKLGGMILISKK